MLDFSFYFKIYLEFTSQPKTFYLQLGDTTDFKCAPELQQTFDRVKRELIDATLRLAIPNSKNTFLFYVMPLTMALELHSFK